GAQPMVTPDGKLVVVYNGEIYNHRELRTELEALGHRFLSDHCDTEVLLHGYREWGEELPDHLNGMWAFAIYDCERRRMFLSRDRFGQKPLFYTYQNDTFAFASELSSLIQHSEISASPSPLSVQKYFAYGFLPAPHSLYESIRKLPGGHNLSVDAEHRRPVARRYWDFLLEPSGDLAARDEEELAEELRTLLRKAVQRHLISDVPVGLFLSGGLDSSAIACFATDAGARPAWSFCVGFDAIDFDESAQAAGVAQVFGTDHVHSSLPAADFEPLARELVQRIDEPQ